MKKQILNWVLISSVAIFGLVACSKTKDQRQPKVDPNKTSEVQNQTEVNQHRPDPAPRSLDLPSREMAASERAEFLRTTRFNEYHPSRLRPRPVGRFNYNLERNEDDMPLAPVVHPYVSVTPQVVLAAKFPISFFYNLPQEIQRQVPSLSIDALDIFFIPQEIVPYDFIAGSISLKAGYWAYPEMPFLDTIVGNAFNQNVRMALYHPDHSQIIYPDPTNRYAVREAQLRTFNIYIHDGAVSPNTGHLNLTEDMLNTSFWSLVVSDQQRRAAVTLHWLLGRDQYRELSQNIGELRDDYQMSTLETNMRLFRNPLFTDAMMQKLRSLVEGE